MKRYFLILIIFSGLSVSAQTVLMQEKVDSVYQEIKFGVNSKHFVHTYISFGFVFGEEEVTKFGNTNTFGFGLRYKLKLINHLATGLDLAYNYSTINFPTHGNVDKDKYQIQSLKYAWFFRINYGHRGNIMGKFIDVGAYGTSTLFSQNYVKLEGDYNQYQAFSYTHEELKYLESFNYGLLLRLGFNQFVFFSEYRMSNMLKPHVLDGVREVPKWTIGLQIGLHR